MSARDTKTPIYFGWIFVHTSSGGHGVNSSEATDNQPMLIVTIPGAAPPSGVRDVSPPAYNPGDSVNVSITFTVEAGAVDVTVKETIPSGWTVANISDGGTLASDVITWTLAGLSGSKTVTYTATAPDTIIPFSTFSGTINDLGLMLDDTTVGAYVPFYETGNVLAVGVWNTDNGSSDLAVTADLSDSNGMIYVQDTSAEGGWPSGTSFRWKTVLYDDGFGAEEPGWQQRDFAGDTEANDWFIQTDYGFTVGHGGNDGENGETLLEPSEETVYTRSVFDAANYASITTLTLKMIGDDSAVAWLNGVYIGVAGGQQGDNGETPEEYTFDTTTQGSGGISANPATYEGGEAQTFVIPVILADIEPVSVSDWQLY